MTARSSRIYSAAIFLGVSVVGALVALAPSVPAVAAVLILTVMALAALTTRLCGGWDGWERRRLSKWTAFSFCSHLFIGLAITSFTSAYKYFGPDAIYYHALSTGIARHWQGLADIPAVPAGKEGFPYLLASFYWVFGTQVALGVILNAGFAAALVPLLSDCTRTMFGREPSRYVAPIVSLMPSFLVWPSQLLREAGALMFLAVTAACAARLARRWRLSSAVLMVAALALLFTFRGFVALFVTGAVASGVAVSRRNMAAGLSTAVAVSLLLISVVAGLGVGREGYEATIDIGFQTASAARADLSNSAGSGFDVGADISSPAEAVAYLPIGLVRLFLGPFPWEVQSVRQMPALLDAFAIWALVPGTLRGLQVSIRRTSRTCLVLLLPPAGLAIVIALVIGNFGTLLRERTQVFVFIVPFIALGVAHSNPRRFGPARFIRWLAGGPLVAAEGVSSGSVTGHQVPALQHQCMMAALRPFRTLRRGFLRMAQRMQQAREALWALEGDAETPLSWRSVGQSPAISPVVAPRVDTSGP